MRIDPRIAGYVTAAAAQTGRPVGATPFKLASERAGATASARSAAPLQTLDAILMLQGEDDQGNRERKRRAARRGQDLLDALDGLKAALLSGTLNPADLRRLSDRLGHAFGPSGDPGLDGVIAAIELRAKVELAKLGMT